MVPIFVNLGDAPIARGSAKWDTDGPFKFEGHCRTAAYLEIFNFVNFINIRFGFDLVFFSNAYFTSCTGVIYF